MSTRTVTTQAELDAYYARKALGIGCYAMPSLSGGAVVVVADHDVLIDLLIERGAR